MAAQQLAGLGSALIIPLPCRRGRRAELLSSPLTCSGALTKWRGEKTAFHLREPQFPRPLPFPSKFDFLCVCVRVCACASTEDFSNKRGERAAVLSALD